MFELLFIIFFVISFAVFGFSLLSVAVVFGVSLLLMIIMGMLGVLLKMLPWLLVVGLVIYFVRKQRVI